MNRSLRLLALLSLVFPACSDSSSAEPGTCTLIGCTDGLAVAFVASSWPAGDYRLDVTADGLDYHCETTLPLDADAPVTCSSPNVMLEVSGSALPAEQQSITGMRLFGLEQNVVVTLSRDGLPLATETFYPEYDTMQPNGPDCGPTCHSDQASMQL